MIKETNKAVFGNLRPSKYVARNNPDMILLEVIVQKLVEERQDPS